MVCGETSIVIGEASVNKREEVVLKPDFNLQQCCGLFTMWFRYREKKLTVVDVD